MEQSTKELVLKIAQILYDKKARNIVALDVEGMTPLTDAMVIATGRSVLQAQTLTREVQDRLAEENILPTRREGYQDALWAVLDYGVVIVHIFHEEEREFYQLDKLWEKDGNRVPLPFEEEESTEA